MKSSYIFSAIICMIFFLSSCNKASPPVTNRASVKATEIIGIDISKYQGSIDFNKIKAAGIRYVFVRATEGVTYQDANFKTNYLAARAAGLTTGAYHFYETNDDPSAQLTNFTSAVILQPGDLPPVVDIEKLHDNDQLNLTINIQTYLDGLESHYGVKPIIYSGLNFSNQYMTEFGDYPLWLAEYRNDKPMLPNGWSDWTFWQWSQSGKIDGINGHVDTDRFNGDETRFQKMLIK